MTLVKLYGALAREFVKEISLNVTSVREAVSALEANFPGFRKYLVGNEYHIFVAGLGNLSEKDLELKTGTRCIKIAPVLKGSKKVFKIVLGIALIVIGIMVTPINPGLGSALIQVGISLTLSGIMELLFTPPTFELPDSFEQEPSYSFNGALNIVPQGYPVPVGYGRTLVGSVVIGAGIHTRNN